LLLLQDEMAKLAELEGTSSSAGNAKAKLNNVLMQMRKNCNHPDLITSAFTADLDYPPPEVRSTAASGLLLTKAVLACMYGSCLSPSVFAYACQIKERRMGAPCMYSVHLSLAARLLYDSVMDQHLRALLLICVSADMCCCCFLLARAQVLAAQSGKMGLLDRLLKQLQARGHKVLIFSQVRRRCCKPVAPQAASHCGLPTAIPLLQGLLQKGANRWHKQHACSSGYKQSWCCSPVNMRGAKIPLAHSQACIVKRLSMPCALLPQMTKMLDLIESYLEQTGHKPCRIDGSMQFEVRSSCAAGRLAVILQPCNMLTDV
jgi:SNF2 family DNA or RNA helicase